MSYFLENEEVNEAVEEVKAQDGIASIEPLLDNRIVRAIREMGFEKLSPIQEQAIPYLLQGEDIIGQAQTGTGKTAAFGIPAIQHINPDVKKLQTIILCPTRELAIQAAEELRKIAKYMHGIKVLPVYGGQDISRQIAGLRGVQIIVGTPGRVMDHMRRHTIKLDLVNMVVLDEADEMLNMGFREDMELILGQIPREHQTALVFRYHAEADPGDHGPVPEGCKNSKSSGKRTDDSVGIPEILPCEKSRQGCSLCKTVRVLSAEADPDLL